MVMMVVMVIMMIVVVEDECDGYCDTYQDQECHRHKEQECQEDHPYYHQPSRHIALPIFLVLHHLDNDNNHDDG